MVEGLHVWRGRSVNIDASNIVWIEANKIGPSRSAPKISYLWGKQQAPGVQRHKPWPTPAQSIRTSFVIMPGMMFAESVERQGFSCLQTSLRMIRKVQGLTTPPDEIALSNTVHRGTCGLSSKGMSDIENQSIAVAFSSVDSRACASPGRSISGLRPGCTLEDSRR